MSDKTNSTGGRVLQAEGLCKSYGKQQVLHNLNLTIEPGCVYGLIGRNGAGKTTLLSILTGQNTMDSGKVTYGGEPVWENPKVLGDLCFARELNATAETAQIRVKDYLRAGHLFCPHWDREMADSLIKKFGIDPKKSIAKLSKGQMSMVTITAALASKAPVTILDEPAAGLDVIMREKFYRMLLEEYAATGRTFIVSTHIIEEASGVFERVIVLDEGHIIADRPTEELIDEFRYVSGEKTALDAALSAHGVQPLQMQELGAHKMAAVRGDEALFEALAADPALTVAGMNLQNVFVALCGHGDEEG